MIVYRPQDDGIIIFEEIDDILSDPQSSLN